MQLIVELSQTAYEQLLRQAQLQNRSPAEIAAQLLEEAEANRNAAVIEQMRAEGVFLPKQPLPPGYQRQYKRIEVQGKPVSECLIEERR